MVEVIESFPTWPVRNRALHGIKELTEQGLIIIRVGGIRRLDEDDQMTLCIAPIIPTTKSKDLNNLMNLLRGSLASGTNSIKPSRTPIQALNEKRDDGEWLVLPQLWYEEEMRGLRSAGIESKEEASRQNTIIIGNPRTELPKWVSTYAIIFPSPLLAEICLMALRDKNPGTEITNIFKEKRIRDSLKVANDDIYKSSRTLGTIQDRLNTLLIYLGLSRYCSYPFSFFPKQTP